MKVSIVTEGFYHTGYGHITRCLSLYQAFEERNILPALFVNGDDECKSFIPGTKYEVFDWLNNQDELISKIKGSEIVIIDSYLAPLDLYQKIASCTTFPLYIDDYLRLDYPEGTVLNGSIDAEQLRYPIKTGTTYLLGPKYIPLRKDFWQGKEKTIKSDIQSVLITFGGQDLGNLTPRMLRLLVRNQSELNKKIIVGGGFKNLDLIHEAKDKQTEIYHSPSSAEMMRIMFESDIAISAAGQTIYELARVGVPTIAISVAENQKNNLTGWIKEEFLTSDFNYETVNLENRLLDVFNDYKKRDIRLKLSAIGRKKVDGLGAKRVVQSILDQMISRNGGCYLRRALDSDAMPVFNLSNEHSVRLNSVNQSQIKWQDHIQWYSEKINDENCLFLLAFNGGDEFVGQVRFDIKDNNALINISIDKNFRGKGLSSPLLIKSSFQCLNNKPNIKSIFAYIRPSNTASIKAFSNAAYIYSHEEFINGEKFIVYKLARQV
jgi:spore coat polysaccharide biosynthesis predicted glycosyltransferase SpsG/RimJ/RimL family protein N-acetyltransferase